MTGLPEVSRCSLGACRTAPFHDHVAFPVAVGVPRDIKRDVIMKRATEHRPRLASRNRVRAGLTGALRPESLHPWKGEE